MTFIHLSYKALVCLLLFLLTQLLLAQTHNNDFEEGKLFLKLKGNVSLELPSIEDKSQAENYPYFNDLLQKVNTFKLFKPFECLKSKNLKNVYQVEFENVKQYFAFSEALKKYDMVEYVEPIPKDYVFSEPNDNYFNHQWHLDKIEAIKAWNMGVGSERIVVAVIDDAIKTSHEDLKNIIWTNHSEIPNNNIDDDNNGFIDDYQGYDVADNDKNTNPPINSPYLRHGTHVTGIVAAQTNNEVGVASIGNGIRILPIKATKDNTAPDKMALKTQISHGWQGVSYAIAMNVDIINMSWGSSASSQTYQSLINEAHDKGIIVVAAAGNNGDSQRVYPAAYDNVVAVAATRHNDTKLGISSFGDWVDVSAPGETIISTSSTTNSAYENNTGTSMASPLVAGLLGLMWSYDRTISPEELLSCLFSTTDPISTPVDNKSMGAGRINANQALMCLIPPSTCEPPNAPITIETEETTSMIVAWEATSSTRYRVAHKISGLNNIWRYNEVSTPTITLQGLIPDTDYIIKIASICEESISEYSAISYFSTPKPEVICSPPTTIENSQLSSTSASFNWENTGENYYRVAYKLATATSWMYSETVIASINLEALEPNQNYTLKVASLCEEEMVSEYSSKVYFTTEPTPCYSPSQPVVKELSDTESRVSWEGGNTDRFRVAYKPTASIVWTYEEVLSSIISLKNLQPELSYILKVASICGESISDYTTPIEFTTEPMPCRIPLSPTISELTEGSAVFSWDGEPQNTYKVAFKSFTSLSWSYLNSETTNIYISDLVPNNTYQLKVASICGETLSDYTEPIQFITTKAECPVPIDVRTHLIASQKVRVDWSVENDNYLEGYIVRYRPEGTAVWQKKTTTTPFITIGFLRADESYELQVSTTCTGDEVGKMLFSEVVFFKTRDIHKPIDIKDPTIGTSKSNFSHTFTALRTYPNPSNGGFSIQFYQETAAEMILQIYDESGKIIHSELWDTSKGNNRFEIDLSNQPKGKYFLQLTHDSTVRKQTILLF